MSQHNFLYLLSHNDIYDLVSQDYIMQSLKEYLRGNKGHILVNKHLCHGSLNLRYASIHTTHVNELCLE